MEMLVYNTEHWMSKVGFFERLFWSQSTKIKDAYKLELGDIIEIRDDGGFKSFNSEIFCLVKIPKEKINLEYQVPYFDAQNLMLKKRKYRIDTTLLSPVITSFTVNMLDDLKIYNKELKTITKTGL